MTDPAELRLVGVGASAGGLEALIDLVAGLDPDMPAAVLVVLHQPAEAPTVLPRILSGHSTVGVQHAEHGAVLEAGRVYVARPDHHLTVRRGRVFSSHGPKENGHRPAVDPLLRSIAVEAGPGSVAVVLSGMLDDGAAGMLDVVRHGGTALVQDPEEALYAAMPTAALAQVPGALVRRAAALGPALSTVLSRALRSEARPSARTGYELHMSGWDGADTTSDPGATEVNGTRGEQAAPSTAHSARRAPDDDPDATDPSDPSDPSDPDATDPLGLDPPGPAAGLACPDCSGPLFDLTEGSLVRYRCRVGHAWSLESLRAEQARTVEVALYTALRALEDKAALHRRVADVARSTGAEQVARRAQRAALEALYSARTLRDLVAGSGGVDEDEPGPSTSTHDAEPLGAAER